MNMIVCVKQIMDPEMPMSIFKIDPEAKRAILPNNMKLVVSDYDKNAVEAALINLTTTKGNVKRARVYPWQESELPALSIFMGADDVINELQSGFLDWQLNLIIESHVQEKGDIDQKSLVFLVYSILCLCDYSLFSNKQSHV